MMTQFHLIQTLLHITKVVLGYIVMLCVMSFNSWLLLAVVLGGTSATLICSTIRPYEKDQQKNYDKVQQKHADSKKCLKQDTTYNVSVRCAISRSNHLDEENSDSSSANNGARLKQNQDDDSVTYLFRTDVELIETKETVI